MVQNHDIFLKTDQYRVWIDQDNIGRIKILRRINFVTLIGIIKQIAEIQQRNTGKAGDLCIYIPSSLKSICSENLLSFIEFSKTCCDMNILVIEAE
jgi:hypothetical protein